MRDNLAEPNTKQLCWISRKQSLTVGYLEIVDEMWLSCPFITIRMMTTSNDRRHRVKEGFQDIF